MSSNPNYDSDLCGKVPIHLINTVQPYGVLLVLDRSSLAIIQLSENAEAIFGLPAPSLIQAPLSTWLDQTAYTTLQSLAAQKNSDKFPQIWSIRDKKFLSLIHIKDKYILVEIDLEPYEEKDQRPFVSIYQEIKYSMA